MSIFITVTSIILEGKVFITTYLITISVVVTISTFYTSYSLLICFLVTVGWTPLISIYSGRRSSTIHIRTNSCEITSLCIIRFINTGLAFIIKIYVLFIWTYACIIIRFIFESGITSTLTRISIKGSILFTLSTL